MNWLDIFLIILNVILFIVGIITIIVAIIKRNDSWSEATAISIIYWTCYLVLIPLSLILLPFAVLDRASGVTIGTITSVNQNFFGTTALYIKTSEVTQEKYCIEFDEDLINKSRELIGQRVKITYGKRVGLYSTTYCKQAPIEAIERVEVE
jgi:hypothetical protein